MKNYLVLFSLLFSMFFCESSLASEISKPSICLVVGSTRENVAQGKLIAQLYGDNLNMNHENTFGPNTWTCDLKPCAISNQHFTMDVLEFPIKDYVVEKVFFERVTAPSIELLIEYMHEKKDYLGQCIKHIAQAMPVNAELIIEWYPSKIFIEEGCPKPDMCNRPFNGVVCLAKDVFCGSPTMVEKFENKPGQEHAKAVNAKIEALLAYYHEHGMGKSLDYLRTLISVEITATLYAFFRQPFPALNGFTVDCTSEEELTALADNPSSNQGEAFDKFIHNTLLTFLISDLIVDEQKHLVHEYLCKIGFYDVTIERATSPNGRKHVWLIRAKKGNN